jgi:hypothetical protein
MGLPVVWIDVEQLEMVRKELRAMPEQPLRRMRRKQAIQQLIDDLRAVAQKGYSRAEIAEKLSSIGVPITAASLRVYLQGGGDKKRVPCSQRKRREVPATAASNAGATPDAAQEATAPALPAKPAERASATAPAPLAQREAPTLASPVMASAQPTVRPAKPVGQRQATALASPAPTPGAAPATPGMQEKDGSAATGAAPARRSEFVVRKDTEDL